MQKFILASLFSAVVLLGLVAPASALAIGRGQHETNAMRFARGLPPNAPSRRSTAPVRRTSPTPPNLGQCAGSIEVRALDGTVLGCLDNGGSSHGLSIGDTHNWPVTYTSSSMTFNNGASYLGAHDTPVVVLGPSLPTSVFLQKVSNNDANAEDNLWNFNPTTGRVTATWTNPGNVQVSAQICRQAESVLLSGNCQAAGLVQVQFYYTPA